MAKAYGRTENRMKAVFKETPGMAWGERKKVLLESQLELGILMMDYRSSIKGTPWEDRINAEELSARIIGRYPKLTKHQRKSAEVWIKRAAEAREKVRELKDLPKRKLFVRAFGKAPENHQITSEQIAYLRNFSVSGDAQDSEFAAIPTPYSIYFSIVNAGRTRPKYFKGFNGRYCGWQKRLNGKLNGLVSYGLVGDSAVAKSGNETVNVKTFLHEIEHAHHHNVIRPTTEYSVSCYPSPPYLSKSILIGLQSELIAYTASVDTIPESFAKKLVKDEMEKNGWDPKRKERLKEHLQELEEKIKETKKGAARNMLDKFRFYHYNHSASIVREQLKRFPMAETQYNSVFFNAVKAVEHAKGEMPLDLVVNLISFIPISKIPKRLKEIAEIYKKHEESAKKNPA